MNTQLDLLYVHPHHSPSHTKSSSLLLANQIRGQPGCWDSPNFLCSKGSWRKDLTEGYKTQVGMASTKPQGRLSDEGHESKFEFWYKSMIIPVICLFIFLSLVLHVFWQIFGFSSNLLMICYVINNLVLFCCFFILFFIDLFLMIHN